MLSTHVRVSFGLQFVAVSDGWDMAWLNLWMIIGISLFGYSIGNISSYLNYARKEDLE
jgi:hypothetical protein